MPPLAVIAVLALATYRLTRLCTADTITLAAREAIFHWAYSDDSAARRRWLEDNPKAQEMPSHVPRAGGLRTWIHALVTCDQCLGVWWGSAVYVAWWQAFHVETDVVEAVLTILAICGLQSLLAWAAGVMQKTEERLDEPR